MILRDNTHLHFIHMGLFERTGEWIHPITTIDSYEIIYVLDGKVHIREGETQYHLEKGEMLLLSPNVEHGGTEISCGRTSFYWLHFLTDTPEAFAIPKRSTPEPRHTERVMKEVMQSQQRVDPTMAELILARWLLEGDRPVERRSKRAHEIAEYVRIHAHHPLSVEEVAAHFGYAPDHLSRILRQEFGMGAKAFMIEKRLEYIESILLNTNEPIKEVASRCGFEDENIFVKFFKYHEGITPTEFRNGFFRVYMNHV